MTPSQEQETKKIMTLSSPPVSNDVINLEQVLTSPIPTLEGHRSMIERKQAAAIASPGFLYGSFAGNIGL